MARLSRAVVSPDNADNDSPDLQFSAIREGDRRIGRIFWVELYPALCFAESLDGVFTVDHRDHNILMFWIKRPVDHHLVAIFDAGANHRIAPHRKEERCRFVADEVVVQVEAVIRVIGCRRRKTRTQSMRKHRQSLRWSILS